MADDGISGYPDGANMTKATLYAMFWVAEHYAYVSISVALDMATKLILGGVDSSMNARELQAIGEARTALADLWAKNKDAVVDRILKDAGGRYDSDRDEVTRFVDWWLHHCGEYVYDELNEFIGKNKPQKILVWYDGGEARMRVGCE